MIHLPVQVERLEHVGDLDCLIKGDCVRLRVDLGGRFTRESDSLAAYHGKSEFGQYQFVVHMKYGLEYLCLYEVSHQKVSVEDDLVILPKNAFSIESFTPDNPNYDDFNQSLKSAGLR